MHEARYIIELMIPFMPYISPLLILLCVIAVADHIIDFVYSIFRRRHRMRY